ncbi:FCD domain-containing protein [Bradyrhizobium sp. URHC0002]
MAPARSDGFAIAADAALARSNRDIARMEAILKEMREAIGDREHGAERHFEAERQLIHVIAKVADNEHALNSTWRSLHAFQPRTPIASRRIKP